MALKLFLLILNVVVFATRGQEQQVCMKLGSVCESMCPGQADREYISAQGREGKRGPVGEKGEMGQMGRKGEKGAAVEVDYGLMEATISQRMAEVVQNQTKRFSDLTTALMKAKEEIEQLKNKTGSCAFSYRGKCFWFDMHDGITCEKASEICAARGGRPANIYSKYHHYMLLEYLRMFASAGPVTHAWLGMKYSPDANAVTLSDGTPAPFVKWYSRYPRRNQCCCIYLEANRDRGSANQNLVNSHRDWAPQGVICEV